LIRIDEALREGHAVRGLVRKSSKKNQLPRDVQVVIGDVTLPDTLSHAVDGVDAVVFTLAPTARARQEPSYFGHSPTWITSGFVVVFIVANRSQ
jgi:uncharacterized protein YbjT (DUF2867 family)